MKKKDKPSISIMIPKEKHSVGAPSSFYSFFTLFAFALGLYSSLLLMISSAVLDYKIVLILGLFSFFLTILQKIKKLPVRFLVTVLPYVFTPVSYTHLVPLNHKFCAPHCSYGLIVQTVP